MKSEYIIIGFIIFVLVASILRRQHGFNSFSAGVKEGTLTVAGMFSYIIGFVFMLALIESCGILTDLGRISAGAFSPLLLIQMIMRPFSGSSSLALMSDIYGRYGPDSYDGILSTLMHTISDSTVYIVYFYFSTIGIKKYGRTLFIGIMINIVGFLLAFFIVICFF